MKKLIWLLVLLLGVAGTAFALPPSQGVLVDDGTTTGKAVNIRFPNSSITSLSNGTVTLDLTGATGAPLDAPYLTTTTNGGLSNELNLGALTTGILKITVTDGVALPATAEAADFPTLNQNTTGTAAGLAAQYIDWSASSGGNSIANKPTLGTMAAETATNYVAKSVFDAHTLLYATSNDTPVALTVGEQTVVGRATGGNIAALAIDADLSTTSENDDTIPSAKAVKAAISAAAVAANSITETELAADLNFADGDFIDLSAVTMSASTDEGLALPAWANVTPATTTKYFLTWDTSAKAVKVQDGGSWYSFAAAAAPVDSPYLLIGANDATLTADRRLALGVGLAGTDGGANSTYTVAVDLSTLVANQTLWDGSQATRTLTFNVSGTDPVLTIGNSIFNVSTGTLQYGGVEVAKLVSPSFTTPTLGVASATSINKVTLTAPASAATLTLADGSSLITSGAYAITLTSTATTNVTLPTSGTLYGTASGSITSAQLYGSLSNETGSAAGALAVFSSNPTISGITMADGTDIAVDTGTGTKIGTATSQKIGFFNATPIIQPSGDLVTALGNLGLVASGTVALATSATNAVNVGVASETSDTTCFPLFVTANTGNLPGKIAASLTFNSNTGILAATGFSGPLTGAVTGNADSATLAATVTVVDSTDSSSYIAMFDSATGSLAAKTDAGITYNATTGVLTATGFSGPINGIVGGTTPAAGTFTTLSAGASGFAVDADGDVTLKSVTVTKASGVAGDVALYEANSTDTDTAGFKGPSSLTTNNSYRGQFSGTLPNSANQVMTWAGNTYTGAGTPADPFVYAMGWADLDNYALLAGATFTGIVITPATAAGSAGLRLPHGTAPSSPTNGDIWTTTAGVYARVNGGTVGPFGSSLADVIGGSTNGAAELAAYSDTDGKHIGRSYVAFSGPGSTMKTKTISNADETIAELGQNQTFTGNNTYNTGAYTFGGSGSVIPWKVGTGTASNTTEGTAYWESDTDILTIGDGATGIGLDFTAGAVYTFPAATATLARTDAGQTFTGVQTFTQVQASSYVTGLMPSIVLTTASGVHDGSNDQATMTDSGESFTTSQFVGMTVYNVTDGSSCTVTANDGTTITCTLAGGTQNDWDTNDVWQVGPGPYQGGSWFYVVAASTIRHPATVGYTVCYESDATAVLTVEMASDSMIFQGVLDTAVTALDAGDAIDSSGSTTGDYQCIHNKSATEAQGKGKRGTWVDGGAT